MKRVYMIQPNSQYGDSIYFPYAAGCLIAYAFEDTRIKNNYEFCGFLYKKENIEAAIERIKDPDFIGFSCYVWNFEYNKALAKKIKELYPDCVISFGGHQVSKNTDLLNENYIDFINIGEGETVFRELLLYLIGHCDIADVPNLYYKSEGRVKFTRNESLPIVEHVSPYTGGWFDSLVENEELSFSAILETNRGCPNRCAFCDWGNIKSHIKCFSMETVKNEIDWMSEHKIEYVYCADANFGIFPRDIEIVDYIIDKHNESGFPEKFQATYSKNNPETVFSINVKLNKSGMSKGATLSFQSLSQSVLDNIYRHNMPIEKFHKLMSMYNANGISAYSEIILGLPGETYNSFVVGIEKLLECGQHMAINYFNCELLDNSPMNDPEYLEKYKIKVVRTKQYQYHVIPDLKEVQEYSNIVVSTSTLSERDWINSNIFAIFIRAFHNLGLLQNIAIYLYYEKNITYRAFYSDLINWAEKNENSIIGHIYFWLLNKYEGILLQQDSLVSIEPDFGKLQWPLDEATFLRIIKQYDQFYDEIKPIIARYFDNQKLFEELFIYQKAIVKTPFEKEKTVKCSYDFYKYFKDILSNKYSSLMNKPTTLYIDKTDIDSDMILYAKNIIWFGRKGGRNVADKISYVG